MLKSIYNILDKYKTQWFIDSGSLLGVIREGTFLEWDRGIDISVLIQNEQSFLDFEKAAKDIMKLGFYCSSYLWNNKIYKYVFTTKDTDAFKYNLDIHLFVEDEDIYKCPQVTFKPAQNFRRKFHRFFLAIKKGDPIFIEKRKFALLRYIAKKTYRFFLGNKQIRLDLSKYVPSEADVYCWTIPCSYVQAFSVFNNHRIPLQPETYLQFRYGNWKIPQPNWNYIKDDGSIRLCSIEEINLLSRKYYKG